MAIIRVIELHSAIQTPFDGQWLVEYDPTRNGVDSNGNPMTAHIITTSNRADAKQFSSAKEAMEYYRQSHSTREDGKPNRPLTAFTVSIEN